MLVDKQSGELFLYGPIGADFFGDGITDEAVIVALDSLGGKRAKVRINSVGGDVFTGISIFNALRRYSGGVDVIIDALAASAASIIALAGETRTSAKGSMWMIHEAMSFAFGNKSEVRKTLAMLEAGDKTLVSIYKDAIKKTEDEIESLMMAETWFTAEESLEVGLSTKIEGESKQPPAVANWFRNAPQAMYNTTGITIPKYRYVSVLR
jgi:ATP-dependent protease ClpP protease subunit